MPENIPVTIRGRRYPSMAAAAKANGVGKAAVRKALLRGTLDKVGTGRKRRPSLLPVTIDGVTYPNSNVAHHATGVSRSTLYDIAREQAGEAVG